MITTSNRLAYIHNIDRLRLVQLRDHPSKFKSFNRIGTILRNPAILPVLATSDNPTIHRHKPPLKSQIPRLRHNHNLVRINLPIIELLDIPIEVLLIDNLPSE